ncbi:thioredoxin domain-containing protein 16-like [Styela clava]
MYVHFVLLFFIGQTIGNEEKSFVDDETFNEALSSEHMFGVFLYSKKDNDDLKVREAVNSIQLSEDSLDPHGIQLGIIDCKKSKIFHCKKPERLYHLILFKDGDVVAQVDMDDLQTLLDVQIHTKSNLLLDNINEIKDREEYNEIIKKHAGKSDFILFYIPELGTIEHLRMINSAISIPKYISVYYTLNRDINDDKSHEVWYLNCLMSEDGKCEVTYADGNNGDEDLQKFIQKSSHVMVLSENEDMSSTLTEMVNKGNDVLLLIAGPRKFESALALAKEVVNEMGSGIHALVVDGVKFSHFDLKSRVENDKIFAIASPGTASHAKYLNIGFLESENPADLIVDFNNAMSKQDQIFTEPFGVRDEEIDLDLFDIEPETIQDDPIAYSVHHNKHVKDLYYFDYKTLPRLTDKTYEKVTQGMEYAVILFTLEFNPRALAALVAFVEIHNAFKTKTKSPMYRVECYNWPDICEKAKVFTSPRMFFYPPETTNPIEYTGMWEKVSMKNAILRYSNPSVIIVRKKEDILPYLPITTRSIIGLFESDDGTTEFRKAAEIMRKDYQFIEVHGEVAKFVAEQYEVDLEHKRLLALEDSFPKHKYGTFTTAQDIINFCEETFVAPELQELNIYSFVDILKDPKPLFIYFWVRENGDELTYFSALKDMIQDIASNKILSDNILFMWMDVSTGTPGEFVLARYNYRARHEKPIMGFFDKKGSVMLKSCQEAVRCTNTSLITWIQNCIVGKEQATYELSKEEWKPRLDGYDFLQFMKDEGTYPEKKLTLGSSDEDEESKPSHRGGRTVIDLRHKHKKEEGQGVHENEKTENREEKSTKSHPNHSEL